MIISEYCDKCGYRELAPLKCAYCVHSSKAYKTIMKAINKKAIHKYKWNKKPLPTEEYFKDIRSVRGKE